LRLVYSKYNIAITFEENCSVVLQIEHSSAKQEMLYDLWQQFSGEEGGWILSEGEKELLLSRNAEVIFNPFSIDMNNKKILGKLYLELQEIITSSSKDKLPFLNAEIVRLLDKTSLHLPYVLEYSLDIDVPGLLKLYNVRLDDKEMSFTERLCTYIRNMHQLCKISLFVFLNLKQYVLKEQLLELYKFCYYEDVYVFDIESTPMSKVGSEKYTVLDKDLCLISY